MTQFSHSSFNFEGFSIISSINANFKILLDGANKTYFEWNFYLDGVCELIIFKL